MNEIRWHNIIKVRSLYYMKLRQSVGKHWTTAGQIVDALNQNRDSMYVLLGRWRKWDLVEVNHEIWYPHSYRLGHQGRRYLDNLWKWYGDRDAAFGSVLDSIVPTFYWQIMQNGTVVRVAFIRYPFQSENDYSIILPDEQGKLNYHGNSRLLVKKDNALKAVNGIKDDLKLSWGNGLINKLVAEGYISRN